MFSFVQYIDKRFIFYVLKNLCSEKLEFQSEFCTTMVQVLCLRFLVCDQWYVFENEISKPNKWKKHCWASLFWASYYVLGFLIGPMTVTWLVVFKMQYISINHIDHCFQCENNMVKYFFINYPDLLMISLFFKNRRTEGSESGEGPKYSVERDGCIIWQHPSLLTYNWIPLVFH